MSRVGQQDTRPEMIVRSRLFAAGLRYRLHVRKLPGAPDIVLARHKTAVFVHGCFWHGHDCRRGGRPKSNEAFWGPKLDRNIERDAAAAAALNARGWHVEVVWECRVEADAQELIRRIQARSIDCTR